VLAIEGFSFMKSTDMTAGFEFHEEYRYDCMFLPPEPDGFSLLFATASRLPSRWCE